MKDKEQQIYTDGVLGESEANEKKSENADLSVKLGDKIKPKRIAELDFIRGICVILMVFDHFMLDVTIFFGDSGFGRFAISYWNSDFRLFWHYTVIVLFFALCGISCTLSRSNFKRGILCFLVACFLSWATYMLEKTVLGEGYFILFGVLHCLGISILLYALCDFCSKKIRVLLAKRQKSRATTVASHITRVLPALLGVVLLAIYFGCIFSYVKRDIFFGKPYEGDLGFFPALIGYTTQYAADHVTPLYSVDWFPVLPYASFLLIGSLIGEYVYRNRRRSLIPVLEHKAAAPVNFIGRHALVIYVLHQAILGGLFFIIQLITG